MDLSEVGIAETTSLFKHYLREIQDSIFLPEQDEDLIKILSLKNTEESVTQLQAVLITRIGPYRLALAKELFFILRMTANESDTNKMDAFNLATIFGQMLTILSKSLKETDRISLCIFMIQNYYDLFRDTYGVLAPSGECLKGSAPVLIYLDDGSYKALVAQEHDTAATIKSAIVQKLQDSSTQTTSQLIKYYLCEFRDRDLREIMSHELILSISHRSGILFTKNFVPEHVNPKIPRNDRRRQRERERNSDADYAQNRRSMGSSPPPSGHLPTRLKSTGHKSTSRASVVLLESEFENAGTSEVHETLTKQLPSKRMQALPEPPQSPCGSPNSLNLSREQAAENWFPTLNTIPPSSWNKYIQILQKECFLTSNDLYENPPTPEQLRLVGIPTCHAMIIVKHLRTKRFQDFLAQSGSSGINAEYFFFFFFFFWT
eukprot:TRINITY_DN11031_c0_g1_i2.p1 TRINITY_DN11031_c0_g1~~TRINITY_DN11031_c0_g1_i2.p1  ORF type:complete len:432 (+),score=97.46 TRINITY_DN11031_c0_g1_i2:717-2012(+)